MRRWHSLLEIIQFPLKMLFVAIILTGLGTLITNQSLSVFWSVNDRNILLLADLFKRTGSFIIINFPFFVMIKFLATKSNSSVPIMIGITGYVLVLVITMLFRAASRLKRACLRRRRAVSCAMRHWRGRLRIGKMRTGQDRMAVRLTAASAL